jgi:hypothetical protein
MKHSNGGIEATDVPKIKTLQEENKENGNMANDNGFSSSDAVLWGAMNNMGRGGYGGYGGGGGAWGAGYGGYGGGHGVWANPSANAVRINRNAQQIENQADCTREVLGQQMDNTARAFDASTRAGEFSRVCDNLSDLDRRNSDNSFRSELRVSDRLADLAAAQAKCCCDTQLGFKDVALEQQKCCCDTQLQISQSESRSQLQMSEMESRLNAEIKAVEGRGIQRALDRAERELQTQTILRETNNGCGVGRVPCNPCV